MTETAEKVVVSALDPMMGLAWAYRFSTDGEAEKVEAYENLNLDMAGEGFLWVHVNLVNRHGHDWILQQPAIPDAARQMLVSTNDHQQLSHDDRHVWGVIIDFIRDLDDTSDVVAPLRFTLGERFLISARRHPLQGAEATRKEIESGARITAPISLLETIVDRVADAISTIIEANVTALNEIEDRVLDDSVHDDSAKLGPIRRASARMHRQLTGMRAIFQRLEAQPATSLPAEIRGAAGRLVQRIGSLHDEVHSTQERARLLQEEISSQISAQTNRNLAWLTAVTALLLPPTLITGMFGMNTKGLIFADNENGYVYAMIMCLVSSALVYLLMRRFGLFR